MHCRKAALINSALTDKRENFYNLWIPTAQLLERANFEVQKQRSFFAKLNYKHPDVKQDSTKTRLHQSKATLRILE